MQRHHLKQVIDAGALGGGNFANDGVAAPVFRTQLAFLQLLFHPVDVRAGEIDLVDRDHDLHMFGGLGVIDGFDGLRHEAIIGRDHKHNDVGNVRAAGSHRGESGVTRSIEEGDAVAFVIDRVGADVLGNAARFAGRDACFADRVHQGGLAVIDVAHERNDGPTRFEFLFGLNHRRGWCLDDLFHFVDAAALFAAFHLEDEAVRFANLGRNVRLDRLVLAGEDVEFHQFLDQNVILQPKLRRQIMDDDGRLDVNDFLPVFAFRRWRGGRVFSGRGRSLGCRGCGRRRGRGRAGNQINRRCDDAFWRGRGRAPAFSERPVRV